MIPKIFEQTMITKRGITVEVHSKDGNIESNSVEANLLYAILQEMKKK